MTGIFRHNSMEMLIVQKIMKISSFLPYCFFYQSIWAESQKEKNEVKKSNKNQVLF